MPLPLYQVNAFSPTPFQGNPAAVCLLPHYPDAAWLQAVAAEMNLSETAFIVPQANHYQLRWFTPQVEVDLCGHATLASAHVLFSQANASADQPITFQSRSGPLIARQMDAWIELDFPVQTITLQAPNPDLLQALNLDPALILFSGQTREDAFLEIPASILLDLQPNFEQLRQISGRGVIVTAQAASGEADFLSRFFAPAVGILEDPVTGSAHCSLYPYWSEKLAKPELLGFQASARGGWVKVRGDGNRVYLAGQAITIWQGELLVPLPDC